MPLSSVGSSDVSFWNWTSCMLWMMLMSSASVRTWIRSDCHLFSSSLQKYEVFELSDIVCAFCQRTASVKFGWCCLMSDNKLWLDRNPHRYCVYTIWMGDLSFLRNMHYWEKSTWTLRWWYHSRFYVVHLIAKKLFQVHLSSTRKLLGF